MIKVLVTGASGQLGNAIKAASGDYPDIEFVFKSKEQLDITDLSMLSGLWEKNSFDYCINCAAYTDVERAEKEPEPAYRINAEGVRNLAEICVQYGSILIQISTDYVFDGEKESGYLPNDHPNPINQYGRSKLQGERYVQEIMKKFFIVRTSWLYSKSGNSFYTKIIEKAKTEDVLYVTDSQKGCPTRTDHLAGYLLDIISERKKDFGIYHFTDGEAMTWYDFAHRIVKENDLENHAKLIRGDNYHTFAKRPENSILLQERKR